MTLTEQQVISCLKGQDFSLICDHLDKDTLNSFDTLNKFVGNFIHQKKLWSLQIFKFIVKKKQISHWINFTLQYLLPLTFDESLEVRKETINSLILLFDESSVHLKVSSVRSNSSFVSLSERIAELIIEVHQTLFHILEIEVNKEIVEASFHLLLILIENTPYDKTCDDLVFKIFKLVKSLDCEIHAECLAKLLTCKLSPSQESSFCSILFPEYITFIFLNSKVSRMLRLNVLASLVSSSRFSAVSIYRDDVMKLVALEEEISEKDVALWLSKLSVLNAWAFHETCVEWWEHLILSLTVIFSDLTDSIFFNVKSRICDIISCASSDVLSSLDPKTRHLCFSFIPLTDPSPVVRAAACRCLAVFVSLESMQKVFFICN